MKILSTCLILVSSLIGLYSQDCNVAFDDFDGYNCDQCSIQSVSNGQWISYNDNSPAADIFDWGDDNGNVLNIPSNYYQGDDIYIPEIIHVLEVDNPGIVEYSFEFYNECGVLQLDFLESFSDAENAELFSQVVFHYSFVVVGNDTIVECFSTANDLNDISIQLDFNNQELSLVCTEGSVYTTPFFVAAGQLYGVAFGSNQCNFINDVCASNTVMLLDNDNDSYLSDVDCDDNDPAVNPGAEEIPYNGKDDDCNPMTLENDLDQDEYLLADDCDDTDPLINPGVEEINGNEVDENCDGVVGLTNTEELSTVPAVVYPNPSVEIIETTLGYFSAIISLEGKRIITERKRRINIGELDPGVYMTEIRIGNKLEYQRIVKL